MSDRPTFEWEGKQYEIEGKAGCFCEGYKTFLVRELPPPIEELQKENVRLRTKIALLEQQDATQKEAGVRFVAWMKAQFDK